MFTNGHSSTVSI